MPQDTTPRDVVAWVAYDLRFDLEDHVAARGFTAELGIALWVASRHTGAGARPLAECIGKGKSQTIAALARIRRRVAEDPRLRRWLEGMLALLAEDEQRAPLRELEPRKQYVDQAAADAALNRGEIAEDEDDVYIGHPPRLDWQGWAPAPAPSSPLPRHPWPHTDRALTGP